MACDCGAEYIQPHFLSSPLLRHLLLLSIPALEDHYFPALTEVRKRRRRRRKKVEKWRASREGISKAARIFHQECPECRGAEKKTDTARQMEPKRLIKTARRASRRATKCRYQFISEIKRAAIIVKQWARERIRAAKEDSQPCRFLFIL